MTAPVNLNQARKAKRRALAKTKATENRVRFGRSKADKAVDEAARTKARALLDQAKRDSS